jgi:hypothetical protein
MLGATSRVIFLLPSTLVALAVAAALIVRPDIDIGFTALGKRTPTALHRQLGPICGGPPCW